MVQIGPQTKSGSNLFGMALHYGLPYIIIDNAMVTTKSKPAMAIVARSSVRSKDVALSKKSCAPPPMEPRPSPLLRCNITTAISAMEASSWMINNRVDTGVRHLPALTKNYCVILTQASSTDNLESVT